MEAIEIILLISCIYQCGGVSLQTQLEHIANARAVSNGGNNALGYRRSSFYPLDPREVSNIVGVPSQPNHLPEAESILPGHTLIRPSLGMLKSAVKFPHRELEDGSGVYGNIDNLGIRYDSKNERVLYSGFRRSPSDYVMVLPNKQKERQTEFKVASTILDLDNKDFKKQLKKALAELNFRHKGNTKIIIAVVKNEFCFQNRNEIPKNYLSNVENHKKWRWNDSKYYKGHDGRLKRFVPVHSKYLFTLRDINKDNVILRNKQEDMLHSSSAENISIEEINTTQKVIESEGRVTEKNWIKSHVCK
ncbi:uncharacterized protein LOC123708886 isoform X3 [Pieris brassicae]|uniref:uncharacterized protein LOC123708886 isoform X3 n=1 Tax=Pieris brassicae TaxID=7116 RepID=UPI001E662567|nr:uncharacterized protein LOC123708886 isoform X3 [Pieris brassicae]